MRKGFRWGMGLDRAPRAVTRRIGQEQLPNAYPQFNDDGDEFQNVNVETLWVNGWFMVVFVVVPAHVRLDPCLD